MFLQVSNVNSSSVAELAISVPTNQVMVKYVGNEQPYLYSNVDFSALSQIVLTQVESFGKWVNTNLKQNAAVTCYTVWVS